MKTVISILLISINLQAAESFVDSSGKALDRRGAVIALAKGDKVFKLQEMILGNKGTIHAIKKAGK